jgi:hypothetical protein
MYPELLKWINECPVCHSKGYKPEMPENIGGDDSIASGNIRMYFRPLEIDVIGFCMQCSKVIHHRK